jgi:hypothetical protein
MTPDDYSGAVAGVGHIEMTRLLRSPSQAPASIASWKVSGGRDPDFRLVVPFKEDDEYFMFDGGSLMVLRLSPPLFQLVSLAKSFGLDAAVVELEHKLSKSVLGRALGELSQLQDRGALRFLSVAAPDRELSQDHQTRISEAYLILTANCNLDCRYCFAKDPKPNTCRRALKNVFF